jgi:hypothetical protein
MVKRQAAKVKKESKMKQKQRQNQQVTVNIGTLAKKPRVMKPTKPKKPKLPPQSQQAPIVTRGPTTFYQQPQSQPQPQPQPVQVEGRTINELYKLIKQQAEAKQPEQQPITTSIAPPPQIGEILKAVNELERVRKVRVAKFEKPELERVFEKQQAGDGLEDKAYQDFNQLRSLTTLFRQREGQEQQTPLLGESKSAPSLNLFSPDRVVPDYEEPNLSLLTSSLLDPQRPTLNRADTDVTDDSTPRQQQSFIDLFSNSPSLAPVQTTQTLLSGIANEAQTEEQAGSTTPPPTPDRETFEEEAYNPEFIETEQPSLDFQPEPPYEEEESAVPNVINVVPTYIPSFIDDEPKQKISEGITEIKIAELPLPEAQPKKEIYRGSRLLPPIDLPREEDTPLRQLLNPVSEATLAAQIVGEAAEEVRAPDQYRTETLVKGEGIAEAEAREAPQGTPKEQLVAFAKGLGVKTASGTSGKHLKTELIRQNIYNKMGEDFEIPTFLGKKTGPQKKAQNATEL